MVPRANTENISSPRLFFSDRRYCFQDRRYFSSFFFLFRTTVYFFYRVAWLVEKYTRKCGKKSTTLKRHRRPKIRPNLRTIVREELGRASCFSRYRIALEIAFIFTVAINFIPSARLRGSPRSEKVISRLVSLVRSSSFEDRSVVLRLIYNSDEWFKGRIVEELMIEPGLCW